MRGPGLVSMLQFAAGLSMAGPMFVIGFEFARTGRIAAGVGFFVLGALVSYAPTYFVRRIGGPRAWLRRRLRRGRGSDGGNDAGGSRTDGNDAGGSRTDGNDGSRYGRLRDRFHRR